jgi:hypothetical protein
LKKPAGSVWFRFYKQKTEKPNRNRKKTEPNWKNRAKPKKPSQTKKTEPKPRKPSQTGFFPKKPIQTETSRFDRVSVRFWFF